jgi:dipeptidyl aminopeptidase/acylaminoacyl peptidase
VASENGRWLTFTAPVGGSYELWRISTADGRLERLTEDRHYVSSFDQRPVAGGRRIAYLRSSPTELPDVWLLDSGRLAANGPRSLTALNGDMLGEIACSTPVERWVSVDGRRIQGWYLPPVADAASADRPAPLVTEIHGGPHTLYGLAPTWEFQVLAGAGIGVWFANPRGSEGYGEAFNAANHRDWGDGPMRDVLGGIESLVADGLADPDRLGLAGGSYGGYLTTWMVAKDRRFRAAITCRSVSDLSMLMLTGDISGGVFGQLEFGAAPWEDPDIYREQSPITYAAGIRTPLLIQHSEQDLRTTVGQAEALFTVLRSHRRPVRLMRVPEETHELTRSGTPFRRVENLVQVRDWFVHFLVKGRRALPPIPRERAGR